MTTRVLTAALAAHQAGLCPIPAANDGTKRPHGAWKQWQTRRPGTDTLHNWFANGDHHGIGLVCGTVSGGLEMIELEGRAVDDGLVDAIDRAMHNAGIGDTWGRIVTGYCEETPSGGYHLLVRTPRPDGNLKLARRPATIDELAQAPDDKIKVLIETRGEGGFTVVAPSNGGTHPTGRAWELLAGGFDTIAELTANERAAVLDVLRTFDRLDQPTTNGATAAPDGFQRVATSDDSRPGDEFNEAHTCAEVLERAGWTHHHTDRTGVHYTRPGKNPSGGASATVWTDNGRATLFSTSIAAPGEYVGDRNLTAWQLHVALNHHGDHRTAATAWRNTHPRAASTPTTAPPGPPAAIEEPPTADTATLTDEFWTARPALEHIRTAAHSRVVSAEAVLHVVLARLAAITPHTYLLPPTIGSTSPLSYFAALIGGPSTGKSAADSVGSDLLPGGFDWLADHLPLGSGEGLIEALFEMEEDVSEKGNPIKVKRQTRHNAYVYIDEGQALAEMGGRSGSTLLSTIRTLWTGGDAGQANANLERRRILPARTYTYGIIAAFQPSKAADLLADQAGGTPQRFGWASATDTTLTPPAPTWPGQLDWQPPARTPVHLELAPEIEHEIRTHRYKVASGEIQVAPLDGHAGLYKLKVAALLAVLDGRRDINLDDWDLAQQIQDRSNAVRTHVEDVARYETARKAQEAVDRRVTHDSKSYEAIERLKMLSDVVQKIVDKVAEQPGELTPGKVRAAVTQRQRVVFPEALAKALADGLVVEKSAPGRGDEKVRLWPV